MQTTIFENEEHRHEGNKDDSVYQGFLSDLQRRYEERTDGGKRPVFETSATGLWEAYLESFPLGERQYHNCNACRRFIERFGGLVTIDEKGKTESILWDAGYGEEYAAMLKIVKKASVTGIFLSSLPVLGEPLTGDWRHLSLKNRAVYRGSLLSASQAAAAKKEDYGTVGRGLGEFPQVLVQKAMTILASDSLYRAEKVLGPAKFLNDLHEARAGLRGKAKDNVLWLAVALAPAGFCHPRTSMVGSLLEDLAAGLSLDVVQKRFAAKMHPLQYLRPQAAPSAGNVAQAEKVFEQLGLASALRRRYARLEECEAFWTPRAEEKKAGGLFSDLVTKPVSGKTSLPSATMTWAKFSRDVLPEATKLEFFAVHANYTGLLTAVDPEAPLLFQWPHPVSWYVYHGGSQPSQWGLAPGYVEITGLSPSPARWGGNRATHFSESVVAILKGARDSRTAGLCLFPEILKSDLHAVRATIEAYSNRGSLEGRDEASACGVIFGSQGPIGARLRMTTKDSVREILVDRWE
jgi:hypothetical protein